jgi:hypothetical protein
MNVGNYNITLKNDDGSTGTAANRFALTGDLTLAPSQSAILIYDSTSSRWRQIANGIASGGGDNLGNHTATQNIALGSHYLSGDGDDEGLEVFADGSAHLEVNTPNTAAELRITGPGDGYQYSVLSFGNAANSKEWYFSYREDSPDNFFLQYYNGSSFVYGMMFDTSGNLELPHGLAVDEKLSLTGDINATVPSSATDYNPTGLATASVIRLTSSAARTIPSLQGGSDGRVLTLMNVGNYNITLKNDDGSTGTAANRFALTGDLVLSPKQSAILIYDSTSSRWRQIANGMATGSGDNLGNHTATQNIKLGTNYLSGDGDNEGILVDSKGAVTISYSNGSGTPLQVGDFISGGGWHSVNLGDAYTNGSTMYNTGYVGFNLGGHDNAYKTSTDTANNGAAAIIGNIFGDLNFVTVPSTGGTQQSLTGLNLDNNIKMTIVSDGKVGIGTDSPQALFENTGSTALSGDIAGAVSGTVSNWEPTGLAGASVIRLTATAAATLTGLKGGVDGRILTLINTSNYTVTLKNNATSLSANRFRMNGDMDLTAGRRRRQRRR